MRCDLCKKADATVHITQDPKPGPVVTIHLCSRCAKKHGVNDPTGFSLADLLVAVSKKKEDPFQPGE
jgi:protein arginine kinase activator